MLCSFQSSIQITARTRRVRSNSCNSRGELKFLDLRYGPVDNLCALCVSRGAASAT